MGDMSFFRDIELLYEIGSLRNVPRGWRQHLGMDCASDLEHTVRVAYLALIIARHEGGADEAKILKMALVHDMPETRVSDHSYVQKAYVTDINEIQAARDMFDQTTVSDLGDVFQEFEDRACLEAKIVKDADNLDINFELKELEEQGSRLNEKWQGFRRLVRDEKLYTQTAKTIWDEVQNSDPSSWHMAMNKWLKVPDAGK
jgi:putative hydrolase of HD superfamily